MAIKDYLDKVIITNFMPLINQNFYSSVIDTDYNIIICTNLSAQAFGFSDWEEMSKFKLSSKMYDDPKIAEYIFKESYNPKTAKQIHQYAQKLYLLHEYVFNSGKIVSFIDMLPYNNSFKTYLITVIPLYYQGQKIIALQTFSSEINLFRIQDFLSDANKLDANSEKYLVDGKLSKREHEIMFLLSNGMSQEQCAQVLGLTRNTIATIIRNLCSKFGIAGANTKILFSLSIQYEYFRVVPASLWKPCIIITEPDAANYVKQRCS